MDLNLEAEVMYQAFRIRKRLQKFGKKCGLFHRQGRFWVRAEGSKGFRDTVWYGRGELLAIYTPDAPLDFIEYDVRDVLLFRLGEAKDIYESTQEMSARRNGKQWLK